MDFLNHVIGVWTIPLAYVVQDNMDMPMVAPDLAPNQPHSVLHRLVESELIAHALHEHVFFHDDNLKLYYYLEEATRGIQYMASIKLSQYTKNNQGAWLALIGQYAGDDK